MTDEKNPCLSGSGLTKIFGFGHHKTVAVDHVDFDFHEGEIVSIVGESGSGKTTLAKMILGLIKATEGEIYFQGKKLDLSTYRKKQEYWKNIQAIFQDPFSSYNIFNKIDSVLLSIGQDLRGAFTIALVIGLTAWFWTARAVRARSAWETAVRASGSVASAQAGNSPRPVIRGG